MIHYKLRQTSPSNESGFTIIESLVAILVAAILLAAIAPVIVISVATRVQAKRIETASDAAKSYLDGIRAGTIAAPDSPITNSTTITDYAAPTVGTLTCTANSYCSAPANNLYCVSVDGNSCTTTSTRNYVIQAIRYNKAIESGTTNITDPTKGYQLGIRVYRADGFSSDGGSLKKAPCKQLTFAAGVGDRKVPLVEMTTEITKNVSFSDIQKRLETPDPTPTEKTCS